MISIVFFSFIGFIFGSLLYVHVSRRIENIRQYKSKWRFLLALLIPFSEEAADLFKDFMKIGRPDPPVMRDPLDNTGHGIYVTAQKTPDKSTHIIEIGMDGRCLCSCADICPLGHAGSAYRCSREALEAEGWKTKLREGV